MDIDLNDGWHYEQTSGDVFIYAKEVDNEKWTLDVNHKTGGAALMKGNSPAEAVTIKGWSNSTVHNTPVPNGNAAVVTHGPGAAHIGSGLAATGKGQPITHVATSPAPSQFSDHQPSASSNILPAVGIKLTANVPSGPLPNADTTGMISDHGDWSSGQASAASPDHPDSIGSSVSEHGLGQGNVQPVTKDLDLATTAQMWSSPDSNSALKGVSGVSEVTVHGTVLAERTGLDGTKNILQMSDGTYQTVDAKTNSYTGSAGTWGNGDGTGTALNGVSAPAGTPPASTQAVGPVEVTNPKVSSYPTVAPTTPQDVAKAAITASKPDSVAIGPVEVTNPKVVSSTPQAAPSAMAPTTSQAIAAASGGQLSVTPANTVTTMPPTSGPAFVPPPHHFGDVSPTSALGNLDPSSNVRHPGRQLID